MKNMAIFHYFLCFAFAFLAVSARNISEHTFNHASSSPPKKTGNFSGYICDPKRYSDIGIDVKSLTFCDTSLPFDVRAKDLVDQLTLLEKVQQLGDDTPGVPRLGIPKYEWWNEALHGVAQVARGQSFFDEYVPSATSFPLPIMTAASFNSSLWKAVAQAISTEARAMYNLGHAGLTFWSPNINLVRDPRWGRSQETSGEDPLVAGHYALNFVRGLQDIEGNKHKTNDSNSRLLKVGACCKHHAAYDVDDWLGVDRYSFDARAPEQDMVESFLRPFEMCVKDAEAVGVMCSYNRVNGIPTCADPKLLRETVRDQWNLHGYIVSDCDSVEVMYKNHKWLKDTPEDAVAQTIRAGLDLDCGYTYPKYAANAVAQGKIRETDIDRALINLYVVLMRLGYFDGIEQFHSLGKDNICANEHIELANNAAREGLVLLKNDNETLPLSSEKHKVLAVVGPHANATKALIGNYAGVPCRYYTPVKGFSNYGEVKYAMGCDVACKNESMINQAMIAAKNADATIIHVGLDLSFEAESLDRVDLLLPGYQTQLVEQVSMVSKGPVILVVISGGAVDISFAKNNTKIKAILWAGYPGQEGGRAIADAVFGKYSPGGRLPVTWYEANYVDAVPMTSMQFRPDESLGYPGRTYKFFNGSTVYPFGHGLSYTKFNYTIRSSHRSLGIKLDKTQHCRDLNYTDGFYKPLCPSVLVDDLKCNHKVKFVVEVHNAGKRDGSEALLVYHVPPQGILGAPIKQLVAFKRVAVPAGMTRRVKMSLNACKSLQIVDYNAYQLLPSGEHKIVIGDNVASLPFHVDLKNKN